jgi:hypothetical protein
VPRTPPRTTNPPIDHATRIQLARSLLADGDVELPIRIAGTLLLLYGQLITRVARLRTNDVITDSAGVRLRLGQQPIEVTGAFADLLRRNAPARTASGCSPAPNPAPTSAPNASAAACASSASTPTPPDPARCSHSPQPSPHRSSPSYWASTTTPPTAGAAPPAATGPATPASPAPPPPDATIRATIS